MKNKNGCTANHVRKVPLCIPIFQRTKLRPREITELVSHSSAICWIVKSVLSATAPCCHDSTSKVMYLVRRPAVQGGHFHIRLICELELDLYER